MRSMARYLRRFTFIFCILLCSLLGEWLGTGFSFLTPALPQELTTISPFWGANAYSLVRCATILWFARVADRWDPSKLLCLALFWMALWAGVSGLTTNIVIFSLSRAMQGLACAATTPAQFKLISHACLPSQRSKMLAWSGAAAAAGFAISIATAAMCSEVLSWTWFFWIPAAASIIALLMLLIVNPVVPSMPTAQPLSGWPGALFLALGLLLVAYALAVIPDSRADSGKVLGPLIGGVVALLLGASYERWLSHDPLVPRTLFRPRGVKALLIIYTIFYGAFAVILFYYEDYSHSVLIMSRIDAALCWAPTVVTGPILALATESFSTHTPAKAIILFSSLGWISAPLALATLSPKPYGRWGLGILSTVCTSIGIDVTHPYTTIALTASSDSAIHGLVGAICSMIGELATSLTLAITNIIYRKWPSEQNENLLRLPFWIATVLSTVGFFVALAFLRFPALVMPADEAQPNSPDDQLPLSQYETENSSGDKSVATTVHALVDKK